MQLKLILTNGGVPLTNLKFLITSFNSIWCRDYGPWTVYSENIDTLRIIDWIYNRTADRRMMQLRYLLQIKWEYQFTKLYCSE